MILEKYDNNFFYQNGSEALNTIAVIQARMGSTRLPGKVMLEISGKPVLWHVINRVSKSQLIDGLVVATTKSLEDDTIEKFCNQMSIPIFRGSEDDVLDRYYQCARKFNIENIVRITADCPLHDPSVIDLVIERYHHGNCDYVSNTDPPTYPDGVDVEIFSFDVLEKAWRNASLVSEREHVTPFIRKHRDLFKISNVANREDLSSCRWTLDKAEDFEFIQKIYGKFEGSNTDKFHMQDIIGLLEKNPELAKINSEIKRNEGYTKSTNEDKVTFKVGFIGNIIQVPEFLIHDPELKLETIICEKDRLNDDLLTFSLVRNIKTYPIVNMSEIEAIVKEHNDIDFFVMCSFGKKITKHILTQVDIYNIHYSQLPYYKGRHPTFWAIVSDEKEIGISIHRVVDEFDEGDIVAQRTLPLYIWMTEDDLFNDLTKKIPELVSDLKKYLRGLIKARKNENGYYYKPVSEPDYTIDLHNDTPKIIYNKVRAQKRYRGAKIPLKNNILWVKEIKFTNSDNSLQTGEFYFNTEGCLCVHYKSQIAIKCLDYRIEEGDCQ